MVFLRLALAVGLFTVINTAYFSLFSAAAGQAQRAAEAPPAFHAFCAQFPSECRTRNAREAALSLTADRMQQLRQVNGAVNRSVREATDQRIYGRIDVWTLPTRGVGDCEDFALLKRHQLMKLGWPSSALLITVVRDRRGEGHAVLSVVTTDGELILDNRSAAIRSPTRTPYAYYTRQSEHDPRSWVWIGGARQLASRSR